MSEIRVILFCCFTIGLQAQNQFPVNPNVTDIEGKRQGKWTILLDKNQNAVADRSAAAFYQLIDYKDDAPVGIVETYSETGAIVWRGYLMQDRPRILQDFSRESTFFLPDGSTDYFRNDLARIQYLNSMRKYDSAFTIAKRALSFASEKYGKLSQQKLEAVGWCYTISSNQVKYTQAEQFALEFMAMAVERDGKKSMTNIKALSNLANIYMKTGERDKAETLNSERVSLTEQLKGRRSLEYAEALLDLTLIYIDDGRIAKCEDLYLEILDIRRNLLPKTDVRILLAMRGLARFYAGIGNSVKARDLYFQIFQFVEEANGKESTEYASALLNIASFEPNQKLREQYLIQARDIQLRFMASINNDYGPANRNVRGYANAIDQLGSFYMSKGYFHKAEPYFTEALAIHKSALSKENPSFSYEIIASSCNRLGILNQSIGRLEMAAAYFLEANSYMEKLNSKGGLSLTLQNNLASVYRDKRDYQISETHYVRSAQGVIDQIQKVFPTLSDSEKESFYNTRNGLIESFNSFCLLWYAQKPTIANDMYNVHLATKGILLNNMVKWKQRIRTSGDKKLFTLFTVYESNKTKLAKWYRDGLTNQKVIDSLEIVVNQQEKELSKRAELFQTRGDRTAVTWKDIQSKLKPNEVAIEIIRVKKYGIRRIVCDSSDVKLPIYKIPGPSQEISYVALLITSKSKNVQLIEVPNGVALEGQYLNYYRNYLRSQLLDEQSYRHFWEPIHTAIAKQFSKKALANISVNLAVDGVYHLINLATLWNPQTREYLSTHLDIRLMTGTRDILVQSKEEHYNNLAYLLGFPDYGATVKERQELLEAERKYQPVYYHLALQRGGALEELLGTRDEVESIGALMQASGWDPHVLVGDKALEETLKDCFKPRVLHIATHGYFEPDSVHLGNPLLKSGLMLAGANRTLDGHDTEDAEDGILTAYEAMNLNLDNTELVVLSACETGLGTVKNGEGVYGLQRAFKVAGARSIIMSLWRVDDIATKELMITFYKNWSNGLPKRSAFAKAQNELQVRYNHPYYWGAFVMIGD